jgi:DNA-binding HxlR family transcriptional regulator
LVDLGVFETVPVSPTRLYHEYVLTEMGRQLFPVVTALRQWGSDYLFEPSEPRQYLVDRRAPERQSRRCRCTPLTGKWCGHLR